LCYYLFNKELVNNLKTKLSYIIGFIK
jgi:hypothetical protein